MNELDRKPGVTAPRMRARAEALERAPYFVRPGGRVVAIRGDIAQVAALQGPSRRCFADASVLYGLA